jgi:hypothetical protein
VASTLVESNSNNEHCVKPKNRIFSGQKQFCLHNVILLFRQILIRINNDDH